MNKSRIKDVFCYGMTLAGVLIIFLLVILVMYSLYIFRETLLTILFPFIAAFIIAYILNPLVDFFQEKKISRSWGILIIYGAFFLSIFLLSMNILPSLVEEVQNMFNQVPQYARQIQSFLGKIHSDYHRFDIPENIRRVIDSNIQEIEDIMMNYVEGLTNYIINFLGHILLLLLIPLLVFYILKDPQSITSFFLGLVPLEYQDRAKLLVEDIDKTLGVYIRSQILISLFVASMVYVGLSLLGVEFALVLALINGVTNIIPYFGPFIGAAPAVLVSLLESPFLALKVVLMITFIQQIESHILAPTILGKNLKLHPVLVILVLLTGGSLFGFLGLIFAVPVIAVLRVVLSHLREG